VLSHVSVGVRDFDKAYALYSDVLGVLEVEHRFLEPGEPMAGWQSPGGTRPLFVIGKPFNGQPHHPGNGQMVAFTAATREMVRLAYTRAMSHGATCEGPPGLRPHYHENYYGAYFRDLDGNKICVVCHSPEEGK
jgi:catechol 2,3-dioxygenase-like lactoylglutathione lyase family enzyme